MGYIESRVVGMPTLEKPWIGFKDHGGLISFIEQLEAKGWVRLAYVPVGLAHLGAALQDALEGRPDDHREITYRPEGIVYSEPGALPHEVPESYWLSFQRDSSGKTRLRIERSICVHRPKMVWSVCGSGPFILKSLDLWQKIMSFGEEMGGVQLWTARGAFTTSAQTVLDNGTSWIRNNFDVPIELITTDVDLEKLNDSGRFDNRLIISCMPTEQRRQMLVGSSRLTALIRPSVSPRLTRENNGSEYTMSILYTCPSPVVAMSLVSWVMEHLINNPSH